MSFSKRAGKGQETSKKDENEFIRSKKSGNLFTNLQVYDVPSIVTEDCINAVDADSIPFKCASACEDDYIIVKKLLEESSIEDPKLLDKCVFPDEVEYKNKTAFKGAARGDNISVGSVLADKNLKREAFGLEPYTLQDFEIVPAKRLKYEDGVEIDGIKFEDSSSVCKYFIAQWVEAIKLQTQVPNILLVLGEGDNHRHDLLLPHQYKSDRTGERPILLKEMRKHILETYPSEMAQKREEGVHRGLEADEVCDAYGFKGYVHYKRTGKFSYIKSAIDKDNWNTCGLSFNYTKAFHFEYPQPWLIEHRDTFTGELELVKGKIKGTGLKHAVYQILLADTADEYGSRQYLPTEMKPKDKYGPAAFYKDFVALESPKDVLEKVVSKFYEWFPYGLQYTAWDGTEVDEDTLSWLNKCFLCMYMRLTKDDDTTILKWLDQYGIDYSHLKGNNKSSAPIRTFTGDEESILDIQSVIESIISEDLKGLKSLKKADAAVVIDRIKEKLEGIDFESQYAMIQEEKA
ncbi:hypothetical protein NVP1161O_184 [Vibrio phage 1.161.O._10N.261.48.C5]|nr:hypothetical protein NVP1161O_184 [Vibrio phage 1.161.O._10N.261.48.C5]